VACAGVTADTSGRRRGHGEDSIYWDGSRKRSIGAVDLGLSPAGARIRKRPRVRESDQQHPVKTLQYLLRARGHDLIADGTFGPVTDAAVRGFQQALHQDIPSVTVDGTVGPVTWQALVSGMLSF
jgi:peptidoglycan hydrolase-like protein with peptidoglycan-binding domain